MEDICRCGLTPIHRFDDHDHTCRICGIDHTEAICPLREKTKDADKKKMMCNKCGYAWTTHSLLDWVTCPNCQSKTKRND